MPPPTADPFALTSDLFDDPFVDTTTPPATTSKWGDYAGMALRGLSGFLASEGGWLGAGVAGAGDAIAQTAERFGGSRKAYNPLEMGAAAGVGAIPLSKAAGLVMRYLKGAGIGAGASAGMNIASQLGDQTRQDPFSFEDVGNAAMSGGVLGTLGAGAGHALETFLGARGGSAAAQAAKALREEAAAAKMAYGGERAPAARNLPATAEIQAMRGDGTGGMPAPPASPTITRLQQMFGLDPEQVARRSEPPTFATRLGEDAAGADPFALPGARQTRLPFLPAEAPPPAPAAPTVPAVPAALDPAVERRVRLGFGPEGVERRNTYQGGSLPDRPWAELAVTHPIDAPTPAVPLETSGPTPAPLPAETGLENARRRGVPFVPREQLAAWLQLKPRWQETAATSGIDPTEDLVPFAQRTLSEPNPRKLMGAERKAASQAKTRLGDIPLGTPPDAPSTGAMRSPAASPTEDFTRLFTGGESGVGSGGSDAGGESGGIDPALLRTLGIHLGSAAGGSALAGATSDDETRGRNMIGGAVTGGLAPLLVTNPALLGRLRYFGMLGSAGAQAKNVLGNTGSTLVKAAEQAMTGGEGGASATDLLKAVFSRQTMRDAIDAFQNAPEQDTRWGKNTGVLGTFSRIMHAVDQGATSGMERGGLSHANARESLFTSEPKSATGKYLAARPEGPLAAMMPFVRTAANMVERGLEHTPGLAALPAVRAMRDPSTKQLLARQGLGGAAALAALLGLTPDSPLATAALGPLALPSEIGKAGRKMMQRRSGDPFSGAVTAVAGTLQNALPVPESTYNPSDQQRAIGQFLASFVPGILKDASLVDPKTLDQSRSVFDPAIAKLPFLNERLLRRKPKRPAARPRVGVQ